LASISDSSSTALERASRPLAVRAERIVPRARAKDTGKLEPEAVAGGSALLAPPRLRADTALAGSAVAGRLSRSIYSRRPDIAGTATRRLPLPALGAPGLRICAGDGDAGLL